MLLTQHPTMLDKYVRTLCGEHQHVLRQFGTGLAKIITWTECHDDPQQLSPRQRGTEAYWKYPKECFELYKSATMHTVKSRVPARLVVLPFAVVLGAVAVWWGFKSYGSIGTAPAESVVHASGVLPGPASSGPREQKSRYTNDADYIEAHKPRRTCRGPRELSTSASPLRSLICTASLGRMHRVVCATRSRAHATRSRGANACSSCGMVSITRTAARSSSRSTIALRRVGLPTRRSRWPHPKIGRESF